MHNKQIKTTMLILLLFMFSMNGLSIHADNVVGNKAESSAAVSTQDSIHIGGNLLNRSYTLGNRIVTEKDVLALLSSDADYKKICNQTKFLSSVSYTFSFFGGFYLGYGAADFLMGKEGYKTNLLIGGSTLAAGLGFALWSRSHLEKTINLYNQKQGCHSADRELSLNVGVTSSGLLGMRLNF